LFPVSALLKPELEAESGNEKYVLRKLQFRASLVDFSALRKNQRAKRKKLIKPTQNEMTIF